MTFIDILLIAGVILGTVAFVAGDQLKNRRVAAEHWLWKKQRLLRARLLMAGGTTVSAVSAAAFVVI